MKKRIAFTPQAAAFLATIAQTAQERLKEVLLILCERGMLYAPFAEKVEGQSGLFEIRLKDASGQYRVFYAYVKEDLIWLLSGFVKKTQKTPIAEIRKALRIRKELGL